MNISIVSEMDSRVLIYPMINILCKFGKVAVVSKNQSLRRLIDGQASGEICGIIIDTDDNSEIPEADYVIFDNYDTDKAEVVIAIVGAAISEQFAYDLEVAIENPNAHILKFGKPLPAPKSNTKAKNPKAAQEETPEFVREISMEERLLKNLADRKSKWLPIITIDELEAFESLHQWPKPSQPIARELFRIIGTTLGADEHIFMKEVQKPNENSININPLYIR